jgi:arylformamidase
MERIDISLTISDGLPIWPGDPHPVIDRLSSMEDGDEANVSSLSCGVHIGTHVDAPLHFIHQAQSVTELSLDDLVGPALVVELLGVEVISEAVLEAADIPGEVKRLLFKTRNSQLWQTGEREFLRDFVAVDESGARWLVNQGVRLVGVDYLSVAPWSDPGPTHRVLLAAQVIIVEGLNLSEVEPGEYNLTCLPLKLGGAEGAPARAILTR